MSFFDDLTPDQRYAVETIDDNLEVIACAGAGKTGVVTRRIINILKNKKDIKPENIVAFTFTEKAAVELKNRIYKYAREELGSARGFAHMYVGTIHGFCLRILQDYVQKFQKFSVLDEIKTILFIDKNYEAAGMKDLGLLRYKETSLFISVMGILNEASFGKKKWPENIDNVIKKYQKVFYDENYFDFSLIMKETVCEIRNNLKLREELSRKLKYLTVDEYQDVNPIQEDLVRLLFELGANICVVGDDDQTIYQFRGSDVTSILNFQEKYGIKKPVILDKNFRSTIGIADIAQRIIRNNTNRLEKTMRSASGLKYQDGDITYQEFGSPDEEFDFIARQICRLYKAGIKYSKIAILLRKRKYGKILSDSLTKCEIPHIIDGVNGLFTTSECIAAQGVFQYLNKEIDRETLIGLWKDVKYRFSILEIENAVNRLDGVNPSACKFYADFNLQKIFHDFIVDIGVRDIPGDKNSEIILYNLGKFSQVIDDFERIHYKNIAIWKIKGFCNFLSYTAQGSYAEGQIENNYIRPDAVNILTIHQAKGLEFSAVFVPQLNRNGFPSGKMGGKNVWHVIDRNLVPNADRFDNSEEDERKLFYVAITRAKKYLFLTRSPYSQREKYVSKFFIEAKNSDYIFHHNEDITYEGREIPPVDEENSPIELNFSILQDFFECPYRFKLSFFYGFVQPLAMGMGYGTSLHEMVMNIHKRYLKGDPVKPEELKDIVNESFFLRYASSNIVESMRNTAQKSIESYYTNEKDDFINIQFAETDIEIDLGDNIKVNGRIDLVKKKDLAGNIKTYIVDFKTQHRDITETVNSEQLKIYALGYKELTGKKADFLQIYNLDNNENERHQVTDRIFEDTRKKIILAANSIRSNKLERHCDIKKCRECYLNYLCLSKTEKEEIKIK